VRGAAVLARADGPGGKRLAAYVVGDASPDDLRVWLKRKLPEYMVPTAFVSMPALPLNPNGKVDRKALPPPEQLRPALNETLVGPRSATEIMLTEIWCEVLNLKQVGVFDNFFELGGHSLMAIQVISRVRETAQTELPMHHFFDQPTIASLGEVIEAKLIQEISQLSEEEAGFLADSAQVANE
jgi:acyl carrier protein